jgi:hypothetical protein
LHAFEKETFKKQAEHLCFFSSWRSKIKKPLSGKSSPRTGGSWYKKRLSTIFFSFLSFSSGSAECAQFFLNLVPLNFIFPFKISTS